MDNNKSKEVSAVNLESFSSKVLSGLGRIGDDQIAEILRENNQTVAAAESLTGGLISERLTNIAGSSVYFMGSIVSYHNRIKVAELKIPGSLIAKFGAVSEEVAKAMAEGIRQRFKTDLGLASTGCAGPDPDPPAPVGLVYVAISSVKGTEARALHLQGTRKEIREKAAQAAIGLLWEHLSIEK